MYFQLTISKLLPENCSLKISFISATWFSDLRILSDIHSLYFD
ncbi:hypothetical protein T01_9059 [Trichinella spiralis]|uniref:Uncharacterized protein n=1 Tax=Trichinella spiralis TaxID=6334 RepID=A0A0V1AIE4_TRISP|nr:hypothetical protein T01_9059 [Trichinella spiralis]